MDRHWKSYLFSLVTAGLTLAAPAFSEDLLPDLSQIEQEQILSTPDANPELIAKFPRFFGAETPPPVEGYTINYNTVSIIEYIRFASKICNVNFLFNEEDLQFTVTVVSDAPITSENVMATLVQMLRIHGLMLLEQGNSLVIHKNAAVRQIATLVFEGGSAGNAPIVTRVFRLKNANPDSIAAIVRPMISEEALLEISQETRQLIVTDSAGSIDKITALIENLDSPHTPLEIRSYEVKFNAPDYLIHLASQIMTPIAQGTPFIMVPQELANAIYVISTPEMNDRAAAVLTSLDVPPKKTVLAERKIATGNIFIIKLEHRQGDEVLRGLQNIAQSLQTSGLVSPDLLETIDSAKWMQDTNSLMFVGSSDTNSKLREFIAALDVPTAAEGIKTSFFVYTPQYRSADTIEQAMLEMAKNLEETKGATQNVIDAIRSMKVNPTTHTILFAGDSAAFPRVKELLATVDNAAGKSKPVIKSSFYVYKIQSANAEQIEASLKTFAKNLEKAGVADEGFVKTVTDVQYIKETNSLLFTGPDDALKRVQEIVPQFDTAISQQALAAGSQFFIYKPLYQKGETLLDLLHDLDANLQSSGLADPAFLRTIESAKWVKNTNSLLFTGDSTSIQRLQTVLASLDVATIPKPAEKNIFLYKPQYASRDRIETYLKQIADSLNVKTDAELLSAIRSMKWIEPSRSFLFNASDKSQTRLKEILANVDTPGGSPSKPSYFIYKLQNASGETIEDDVDGLLQNMKATGLKETPLVKVLETLRYVKETNSILLTGDSDAVAEAKNVIAQYDVPHGPVGPVSSNFFMYKPQHLSAAAIQKSLSDISSNLQKAGLADPSLLAAIKSVKYVETTNSLIFTGSSDAVAKLQELLKEVDMPPQQHTPIQHIGKTTFLLYKLKTAGSSQIISSIEAISKDLKKSNAADKDFIAALSTMKYVRETNSLMFTGTEEALTKVQTLVERFDVAGLAPLPVASTEGPTQFFVYKPQALAAEELEKTMNDFAQNLRSSGLNDQPLFSAISSMKYIEKTQSLVFTGETKSLDRVKELLKEFDVPGNLPDGGSAEPSIQSIDNTSFLVYKLQFHKGDEIQNAMRQIAKDLILTNAPVNQGLLNSINSIQWLEVTNSLLASGDQETLTRLRELIKNLDIPLKQVFIEILILETTATNTLNFGLEWGGKFQFKSKFAGAYNNLTSTDTISGDFAANLENINATTTPLPSDIPFNDGFEFGVIGDIIKHKGQSFVSLGSLLTALQTDTESTIISTPKIIAQDSRTATIFSGQNVPFAGSFIQNNGSNSISTSNIEYRDVGLNLTITPVLGNSDVITLDISLDQSATVGTNSGSTFNFVNGSTATGITTDRTTLQTTVHVPNGRFLVLSGMVSNTNTKTKSGIPCLGGLPIVGAAFSEEDVTDTDTNIVIFMRPTIINSLDDMRHLSEDQEEYFRNLAPSPDRLHQFDEGMELIKSPED